jgi:hypothetical protein
MPTGSMKPGILPIMLYDLHEVAEEVGLSPTTLQNYTARGRSNLVRGEDFIVRRVSPYRKQLMITERGRKRLAFRAYQVYREGRHTLTVMPPEARPVKLRTDLCHSERRLRLKAAIQQAFRAYLDHPCALPNCQCVIHRLGAPQLDTVTTNLFSGRPRWGA